MHVLARSAGNKEFNAKNILNATVPVTRWKDLGIQIDVPPHKLEEIRLTYYTSVTECKLALITHWLNSDDDACWVKLADALDRADYSAIAARIRQRYAPSSSSRKSAQRKSQTPSPTVSQRTWINPLTTHSPLTITVSIQLRNALGYFLLLIQAQPRPAHVKNSDIVDPDLERYTESVQVIHIHATGVLFLLCRESHEPKAGIFLCLFCGKSINVM